MAKYRKKPVVIEAFQMTWEMRGVFSIWPQWLQDARRKEPYSESAIFNADGIYVIRTKEGCHQVTWGDWIIKGIQGELYLCKPDIFKDTYELVED